MTRFPGQFVALSNEDAQPFKQKCSLWIPVSRFQHRRRSLMLTILSVLLVVGSVTSADAQERKLTSIFTKLGFTNIIEVPFETFPAGTYDLRLLVEFSSLSKQNKISTYPLNLSTFQVLITGPQGRFGFTHPQISQRFVAEFPFGLA
jgi:hypothetical protein